MLYTCLVKTQECYHCHSAGLQESVSCLAAFPDPNHLFIFDSISFPWSGNVWKMSVEMCVQVE